jgi:hypothetical protein
MSDLGLIVLFSLFVNRVQNNLQNMCCRQTHFAKTATQSRQKVAVFALSNFIFRLFFGISQAFCVFLLF